MIWLAPVVGLIAGIIGGFFGISGAFIILPALLFLGLVPNQLTAAGTTLFILLPPISILAVYNYWKKKEIDFKVGFWVMGFYIIGGYFGSKFAHLLDEKTLRLLLTILFMGLAYATLYSSLHLWQTSGPRKVAAPH
jgi:uncharacterized membrane protein YfcA